MVSNNLKGYFDYISILAGINSKKGDKAYKLCFDDDH